MAGLFDEDAARSQSLFAALLSSMPQLMAAGAPSTQPGSWGRGIGAAGPAFVQAQQGYMNSVQGQALRALQMKKLQEEMAQQQAWRTRWGNMAANAAQPTTLFGNIGGSDPGYEASGAQIPAQKPTGLFGEMSPEMYSILGDMPMKTGASFLGKVMANNMDTPANIREWRIFSGMDAPTQQQYLTMKRALPPWVDFGGVKRQPSPITPGAFAGETPVTLKPGEQPEVKGAQTEAQKAAELRVKMTEMKPKAENALVSLENQAGVVEQMVDQAIEQTGALTAGYAAPLRFIEGTDAFNLARTIDTIKANIGFDKLQELRANSPTGGALGSTSDTEIRALQSVMASIESGQDPKQLKANLQKVKQLYAKIVADRRAAFERDYGGTGSAQAAPSAPSIDYLLRKYGGGR